jgi:hypothetical protein
MVCSILTPFIVFLHVDMNVLPKIPSTVVEEDSEMVVPAAAVVASAAATEAVNFPHEQGHGGKLSPQLSACINFCHLLLKTFARASFNEMMCVRTFEFYNIKS